MVLMRLELQIRASESRRTPLKLCAGIQLWNPNHRRRVQESVSPEVVWVMIDDEQDGSGLLAWRVSSLILISIILRNRDGNSVLPLMFQPPRHLSRDRVQQMGVQHLPLRIPNHETDDLPHPPRA